MLRNWQARCKNNALETFKLQTHFLLLASPGAGKTIVAANIAKALYDDDQIDYIVCFAPSKIVCQSIEVTFEKVLHRKFNGRLGAVGVSRTYHSLNTIGDLVNDLSNSRVLVVFDEIHHCAGDGESPANVWGLQVLATIQNLATFTLSLTGTPWRTDTLPIPFAKYADPNGNILCDFQYDMVDAIKENVCRMPQITAIDIEQVIVKNAESVITYHNIVTLLKEGGISYQAILRHPEVIKHMLERSINQLNILRENSASAGGLIVASSYLHAIQIQSILSGHFKKQSILVSCRQDDSPELIAHFRKSSSEWIISIAMISEGTDIPRLQVCCNLTDVTTELYFRQILGRVLRVTQDQTNIAYMFMLAEPKLVEYAQRLNEAIPGVYNYQKSVDLLETIDNSAAGYPIESTKLPTGVKPDPTLNLRFNERNQQKNDHDIFHAELIMAKFKSKIISSYLI